MCIVSMIGDQVTKDIEEKFPWVKPMVYPYHESITNPLDGLRDWELNDMKQKLEDLKAIVENIVIMLKAAGIYDEQTGQPECEQEEKVQLIKRLMELCDVDPDELTED